MITSGCCLTVTRMRLLKGITGCYPPAALYGYHAVPGKSDYFGSMPMNRQAVKTSLDPRSKLWAELDGT